MFIKDIAKNFVILDGKVHKEVSKTKLKENFDLSKLDKSLKGYTQLKPNSAKNNNKNVFFDRKSRFKKQYV